MSAGYASRNRFFKWLRYSGLAVILFLLQSVCVMPELFGTRPNFLLALPVLVAACEEPAGGACFALGCGLLYDVIYPGQAGFFPLLMLLACYLCGVLVKTVMRNNLITMILLGGASVALIKLAEWFLFVRFPRVDVTSFSLYTRTLPSILYTILFIPPLYYLVLWIKGRYDAVGD